MADRCRRPRINGLRENHDIIIVVIVRWPTGRRPSNRTAWTVGNTMYTRTFPKMVVFEWKKLMGEEGQTWCTQGGHGEHWKCLDVFSGE